MQHKKVCENNQPERLPLGVNNNECFMEIYNIKILFLLTQQIKTKTWVPIAEMVERKFNLNSQFQYTQNLQLPKMQGPQ